MAEQALFRGGVISTQQDASPVLPIPSLPVIASVDFIVPTLRRPTFLRKCLASIGRQTIQPASILVGFRPDDAESRRVLEEFSGHRPVRPVAARGVGVIGSMSSCLAQTSEQFVALVDDDVELPPHWLETMLGHLHRHPEALAVAGRDFLQDHPEMRRTEKRVADVGRFHWYGRMTGNHHRGAGQARRVDILRGSNCLFRGGFLCEVGFEQGLQGEGAQVSWELALAFHAMQQGCHFFYDPEVEVIHHTAPRLDHDSLHRGGFDTRATADCAFNETFVTARYAPGSRKWTALAYQGAIGSSMAPGFVHFLRQLLTRDRNAIPRLTATVRGRSEAIRQWNRRSRAAAGQTQSPILL